MFANYVLCRAEQSLNGGIQASITASVRQWLMVQCSWLCADAIGHLPVSVDVGAPARERDGLESPAGWSTLTCGTVFCAPSLLDYHGYKEKCLYRLSQISANSITGTEKMQNKILLLCHLSP